MEPTEPQRRAELHGGRGGPSSGGADGRVAGGGDAGACSLTHLPDARPAARSTDAARALPLLRDTAFAAAGAPEPGRGKWSRAGKAASGPEPWEAYIGGSGGPGREVVVHLPHRYPTALPGNSIAPTSARCSRAFARSSPQQRPGFRQQHSAPSLLGLRHLVGGGKSTVRLRIRRPPASPAPRGLHCAAALASAAALRPCSPSGLVHDCPDLLLP